MTPLTFIRLNIKEIKDFIIQDDPVEDVEQPGLLQSMLHLSLESIHRDTEILNDVRQIHDLFLTKDNSKILEIKHKKLNQWRKEGGFIEVTKKGQ